jgi:hypothetical protein
MKEHAEQDKKENQHQGKFDQQPLIASPLATP